MNDEERSLPKPDDPLTGHAISAIWSSMTDDGAIFRYASWEQLARAFLRPFFKGNAWTSPISELRACYLAIPGAITHIPDRRRTRRRSQPGQQEEADRPVPEDAKEFGRFIGEYILEFQKLPRDALLDLYEKASSHLAAIEANIKDCEERVHKHGGDPKKKRAEFREAAGEFGEDESWAQVYRYYVDMNREARDEIVAFLTHEIHDGALRASRKPWHGVDFYAPYRYHVAPHYYEPGHFSEVANKFSREPILEGEEWQRCYTADRDTFFTRLGGYLSERRPWEAVRRSIELHHRLNARKAVLVPALDAYEASRWSLFSTLAVVQIEGLFLDYCEDLGIGKPELQASSLPSKLSSIRRKKGYYHDFPYYAYRLPVIRNHLAHGRLLDEAEEAQVAHMLLLDLVDVCEHVMDRDLLVNILVNLVRRAEAPVQARDALAVAFLHEKLGVDLPPFYELNDRWKALRENVDSDGVATLIPKIRDAVEEWHTQGQYFLGQLKQLVLEIKKRSSDKSRWNAVLAGWKTADTDPEVPRLDRHEEWTVFNEALQRYAPS